MFGANVFSQVYQVEYRPSREILLHFLADGRARSIRDLYKSTGMTRSQVGNSLILAWHRGLVLRTASPIYEAEKVRKGRDGVSHHVRPYHLYLVASGRSEAVVGDKRFVSFSEEYLDPRGGGSVSKAKRVLSFLIDNPKEAFYSTQVVERLSEYGVLVRDVMANVRRFERHGLVYVRGYKTDDRETPFKEGYLLTWVDPRLPREQAILEAVERREAALGGAASGSPLMDLS